VERSYLIIRLNPVFSKGDPILHYSQISLLNYGIFPRKILYSPYLFLKQYSIELNKLKLTPKARYSTENLGEIWCIDFPSAFFVQ
jgi:hypothetical protein